MATVFSIVTPKGDRVYRGSKSAVQRKLATLSRREDIAKYRVHSAKVSKDTKPGTETWTDVGNGTKFLMA